TTVAADLSPRERDVLKWVARGLSNGQIGEKLFLSEGTVRNYVSSILAKLGVTDRTQAAVIALRHGLAGEKRGRWRLLAQWDRRAVTLCPVVDPLQPGIRPVFRVLETRTISMRGWMLRALASARSGWKRT